MQNYFQKLLQFIFLFFYDAIKVKTNSFECLKSIRNYENLHIWLPPVAIFLAIWVLEGLELVSICNSLNNLEEMTIFGRNDTNTEGMTIIRKE